MLDLKALKASKSTNHSSERTGSRLIKALIGESLIATIVVVPQAQLLEEIEKLGGPFTVDSSVICIVVGRLTTDS